jgi:hypothetical protein
MPGGNASSNTSALEDLFGSKKTPNKGGMQTFMA